MTQPPPVSTAATLLNAAAALAARTGSALALTVEQVCAEAGADAQAFSSQFKDIDEFRQALMWVGHDAVRGELIQAVTQQKPGLPRLQLALVSWCDANLARPWLRELAAVYGNTPPNPEKVRSRINGFALMLQLELEALGRSRAGTVAKLLVGITVEVAVAEYEARKPQPEMRQILLNFLEHT